MIIFTEGNLLTAKTDALVNTVNEVGVMGKGIALMFKDAFPWNNREYELACKRGEVRVGHMFTVENREQFGPRWIINFPTKKHWRHPSKLVWIREGLDDLAKTIVELQIRSVSLPPLGCGNGGLRWLDVKALIEEFLGNLPSVDVRVYAPTEEYQSAPKQSLAGKLTPARALVAEMIRRYEVLGFDCSLLEVQKLAWFLQRAFKATRVDDPLRLAFIAGRFGPYSDPLRHVLESLDGSFVHSDKRIADSGKNDVVTFERARAQELGTYLVKSGMAKYAEAVEWTQRMIEGFESPYGMELLATVDWLIERDNVAPSVPQLHNAIRNWSHSELAAKRKAALFNDRVLEIALERIMAARRFEGSQRTLALNE